MPPLSAATLDYRSVTSVNKGKKKGRGCSKSLGLLVASSVLSYASLRTFLDLGYLISP